MNYELNVFPQYTRESLSVCPKNREVEGTVEAWPIVVQQKLLPLLSMHGRRIHIGWDGQRHLGSEGGPGPSAGLAGWGRLELNTH